MSNSLDSLNTIVKAELSVNLNKIALLRNSRGEGEPDLGKFAKVVLGSAAGGITLHPRPDLRHATFKDVMLIKNLIKKDYPHKELNVEGNPEAKKTTSYPGFLNILEASLPDQATLVPDNKTQLTSHYGWDLKKKFSYLKRIIHFLKDKNIRVSLFLDHKVKNFSLLKDLKPDRIELHTGYYALKYPTNEREIVLNKYATLVEKAKKLGISANAGHDLNQENLGAFLKRIPEIKEVSIGHAFVSESLVHGFSNTLMDYLNIIKEN